MISLIVAVDEQGIIGDSDQDGLPWFCPVDLERFRMLTWDSLVVVGRKTWEDMPDSVLEGRQVLVVTSDATGTETEFEPYRTEFYPLNPIITKADQHVVIAGGRSIYESALDTEGLVGRVFITRLPIECDGDIEWPGLPDGWEKAREKEFLAKPQLLQYDTTGMKPETTTQPKVVFEEWKPPPKGVPDDST